MSSKIRASNIAKVTLLGPTGSTLVEIVVPTDKPEYDDYPYNAAQVNDSEWYELLDELQVVSIVNVDDSVRISSPFTIRADDRRYYVSYSSRSDNPALHKRCEKNFEDNACGDCYVKIDGDWYIDYYWGPEDVAPDLNESKLRGEISEAAYWGAWNSRLEQCIADGDSAIGYGEEKAQ